MDMLSYLASLHRILAGPLYVYYVARQRSVCVPLVQPNQYSSLCGVYPIAKLHSYLSSQ